jgi:hypothetical protein
MIVCVLDFYSALSVFASEGNSMVWENGLALAKTFVLLWHLTTIWLIGLKMASGRLENYFRLRCDMKSANYIKIEYQETAQIYLANGSKVTKCLRDWEERLNELIGYLCFSFCKRALHLTVIH